MRTHGLEALHLLVQALLQIETPPEDATLFLEKFYERLRPIDTGTKLRIAPWIPLIYIDWGLKRSPHGPICDLDDADDFCSIGFKMLIHSLVAFLGLDPLPNDELRIACQLLRTMVERGLSFAETLPYAFDIVFEDPHRFGPAEPALRRRIVEVCELLGNLEVERGPAIAAAIRKYRE